MKATFEIKRTADGQFMFNLRAPNNQTILTSQCYASKEAAKEGIAAIRENAGLDERYEEKKGADGSPYFVLHSANHLVIGNSEMYSSPQAMHKGMASVKKNGPVAEIIDLSLQMHA
jgi:uncharacterized protein YegP (UPF0339 family)